MHLRTYFALMSLLAQGIVADDDTSLTEDKQLFRRGIPGCPQKYGTPFERWPTASEMDNAALTLVHTGHYDEDGWKDSICETRETVCFSIAPGFKWDKLPYNPKQIGSERGYWKATQDSSSLLAITYWHNELSFSGIGGSAKVYPAHGFFFICVDGTAQVRLQYSGSNGKGKTGEEIVRASDRHGLVKDPDGWTGPCRCFANSQWDITGSDIRIEYVP